MNEGNLRNSSSNIVGNSENSSGITSSNNQSHLSSSEIPKTSNFYPHDQMKGPSVPSVSVSNSNGNPGLNLHHSSNGNHQKRSYMELNSGQNGHIIYNSNPHALSEKKRPKYIGIIPNSDNELRRNGMNHTNISSSPGSLANPADHLKNSESNFVYPAFPQTHEYFVPSAPYLQSSAQLSPVNSAVVHIAPVYPPVYNYPPASSYVSTFPAPVNFKNLNQQIKASSRVEIHHSRNQEQFPSVQIAPMPPLPVANQKTQVLKVSIENESSNRPSSVTTPALKYVPPTQPAPQSKVDVKVEPKTPPAIKLASPQALSNSKTKINGSISTTITQNQNDQKVDVFSISGQNLSLTHLKEQKNIPIHYNLLQLESKKKIVEEGKIREFWSRAFKESSSLDSVSQNWHSNEITKEIFQQIVQEELSYLQLENSVSVQANSFHPVLSKLCELFILELTIRAMSQQEQNTSLLPTPDDTTSMSNQKYLLTRENVKKALQSTDYFDLFLDHI